MLSCAVFYQITMKKYSLGAWLGAVLLLGSCQSQQDFLFRPASVTHASIAAYEPLQPASEPADTPAPELTAELPAVSRNPTKYRHARAFLPEPTATAKVQMAGSAQPAALQVAPDTSVTRPAANIPIRKIKETDWLTKFVRVLGVFVVLAAIALFITAFTAATSGWTALAFFLYGFIVLMISIPFFVFRGKNSPRRQELERRRAARKAATGQ